MRTRTMYFLVLIFFSCTLSSSAYAESPETQIAQAIDQLQIGINQLEKDDSDGHRIIALASAQIESIIESEHIENPDLYHALGNAYMLNDQIGYAVLSYRHGWQLNPKHTALTDSLTHARSLVGIQFVPDSNSKAWDYALLWRPYFARTTLWYSFIVIFTFGWIACIVSLKHKSKSRLVLIGTILILASFLPLGMLTSEWYYSSILQEAVIVQDNVIPLSGPNDQIYDPVFEQSLDAGVECRVIESRDSWIYIELLDGSECWVPERSIEFVRRQF